MTVLRTEQILHNFEDQKNANFFNLEQVNLRMTLVIYEQVSKDARRQQLWDNRLFIREKVPMFLTLIQGIGKQKAWLIWFFLENMYSAGQKFHYNSPISR